MFEPVTDVQYQVTTTSEVSPETKEVIEETELRLTRNSLRNYCQGIQTYLPQRIVNWVPLT